MTWFFWIGLVVSPAAWEEYNDPKHDDWSIDALSSHFGVVEAAIKYRSWF